MARPCALELLTEVEVVPHPLDGANLQLNRALEHFETLQASISEFLNADGYLPVQEFDPESRRNLFRLTIRQKPPAKWGVLIGECTGAMRAALNYLAWELSILYSGDPPPRANRIEFPIFYDRGDYSALAGPKIDAIDPSQRAIIESLQPYHRSPDPSQHPLWLLHKLRNDHDHRRLHLAAAATNDAGFLIGQFGGPYNAYIRGGILEDGAVIGWLEPHTPEPIVDVHFEVVVDVAFAQPGPAHGRTVLEVLHAIHVFIVEDVFPRFEPAFA